MLYQTNTELLRQLAADRHEALRREVGAGRLRRDARRERRERRRPRS